MKLKIYAVKDKATEMFGNPMFLITNGQALRHFRDEINRRENDNMLNKHPDHWDLYELGEYETDTGKFNTEKPPNLLIRGIDCVEKPN